MATRTVSVNLPLLPHPASPPTAVRDIAVNVERDADLLSLRYRVAGEVEQLRLPAPREPVRADGLWRQTCFEAFIGLAGARNYWEYNFSPSRAWAAYSFEDYREGMSPLLQGSAPGIVAEVAGGQLLLQATLDLGWLSHAHEGASLRLGVTAVIEDRTGGLSYWALAHCDGQADFHHAGSFTFAFP